MRVEFAVFDGLQRRGQQGRHLLRSDDDAVLAVDREDAADEQRLEAQHRHLMAGAVAQAGQRRPCAGDGEDLRLAHLVGKARRAQRHLDALALPAVGAGPLERLRALVVQALQLVLELRK